MEALSSDITGFHLPIKLDKRGKVDLKGVNGEIIHYKMGLIETFFSKEAQILNHTKVNDSKFKEFVEHVATKPERYEVTFFELEMLLFGLKVIRGTPDCEFLRRRYNSYLELFHKANEHDRMWSRLNSIFNRVRESVRAKIAVHEMIAWHLDEQRLVQGIILHKLISFSPKYLGTDLVQDWISWAQARLSSTHTRVCAEEKESLEMLLKKMGKALVPNKNAKPREKKYFQITMGVSLIDHLLEQYYDGNIDQPSLLRELKSWVSYVNSSLPKPHNIKEDEFENEMRGTLRDYKHCTVKEVYDIVLQTFISESFIGTNRRKMEAFFNTLMPFCDKSEFTVLAYIFSEVFQLEGLPRKTAILDHKIQALIEDQNYVSFPPDVAL